MYAGNKIIDIEDFEAFSSFFRGEKGRRRALFCMKLLAIDKVNRAYDNAKSYPGESFAASLLNELGVKYMIGNAERLRNLPEGAFITVSNHPYGGIDGIMLIDFMSAFRSDFKLMVNKILSMVEAMKENFISVTPAGNRKEKTSGTSIRGIRETMVRLREGHPVGFFPSGAVSDFRMSDLTISDRKWQTGILRLIHSAKVPVLPVRFFDVNSPFFYFLGLIDWRIRSLRMPYELFNKSRQVARVGIGQVISVAEQEHFSHPEKLGAFLRKCVYEMPLPSSFLPRTMLRLPEDNGPSLSIAPDYGNGQIYKSGS